MDFLLLIPGLQLAVSAANQSPRRIGRYQRDNPGAFSFREPELASGTRAIAAELGCHPQTVRERIHRFDAEGIDRLGDRPGAGRKRRLIEAERSWIIWLVATDPPGRLVRGAGGELEARDEQKEAHWTLDALTTAARERGIAVGRSQVRRILLVEGVRWRNPHPWGESHDPEFVPKGRGSSTSTSRSPRTPRLSAWMS